MDPPRLPDGADPQTSSSSSSVTLPVDSLGRLMEPMPGRGHGGGQSGEGRIVENDDVRRLDGYHSTPVVPPHTRPWEFNDDHPGNRPATDFRNDQSRQWDRSFPPVDTSPQSIGRCTRNDSRSQNYSPTETSPYSSIPLHYPGDSQVPFLTAARPPNQHMPPPLLDGEPHPGSSIFTSAPYSAAPSSYGIPPRSVNDPGLSGSSQLRPGSVPWDYAYATMEHARPPGTEYNPGPTAHAPRPADTSLPSIQPPFRSPNEPYGHAYPRTGPGYVTSMSPVESPMMALPGMHTKERRTSMESETSMRGQQGTVTSRLGLDPVAKQERRREQNRMAQRAFRARAKMREQEKVNEDMA